MTELDMRVAQLLSRAGELDAADPLGHWRGEFHVPDPELAYLDGNSLGMPPRRTLEQVAALMADEWGGGLITSWDDWLDLPQRVGDQLAPLIGAQPGEVVVHDSVTVNVYQLVRAALRLRPGRDVVAIDPGDFPTDRYVVEGIAAADGLTVRPGFDELGDVAVVVRSMVDYRSAEIVDIANETARATDAGALVIWDLSHAAGVHPVGLAAAGAQLAVGCTYKFLNGGPGSPAFSYVERSLIDQIDNPIRGWFSSTISSRWTTPITPARTSAGCCSARRASSPSPAPGAGSRSPLQPVSMRSVPSRSSSVDSASSAVTRSVCARARRATTTGAEVTSASTSRRRGR